MHGASENTKSAEERLALLEEKVASLESEIQELKEVIIGFNNEPLTKQLSLFSKKSLNAAEIPANWKECKYNGLSYYIVPLASSLSKTSPGEAVTTSDSEVVDMDSKKD